METTKWVTWTHTLFCSVWKQISSEQKAPEATAEGCNVVAGVLGWLRAKEAGQGGQRGRAGGNIMMRENTV